jgi:hypothetical protein
METIELPKTQINGLTFWPIPDFDPVRQAFGADEKHYFDRRHLPKVPREYEDKVQSLFFEGGKIDSLAPQVDVGKATAAMRAWLCSFAPAHESKIATAAYALWLWSTPEALPLTANA